MVFNAPIMAISSMQPNSSHSINETPGLLHSINTQRHTTFGDGLILTQTLRLTTTLGLPWSTPSIVNAIDAWKHSDFLYRNYMLNGLTDSLYNIYSDKKTAKELWESLNRKYKSEDAGSKKFVVSWFLDYKMVDSKSVISQVQDIQVILHEIHGRVSKKQKFQGKCFNCDKIDHKSSECRLPKKNKNHEANMVDDVTQDVADINLCAVISKVNQVRSNPREWWIDTGATRHICSHKGLFTSFEPMNGEKLFMGNSATSEIEGQGKVVLNMTSGKELTLNNVLYVPEIHKNLVSGSLLSKHGFRMVFESKKVVLTKSGMYVGKGYVTEWLFKLNVMTVVPKINKVKHSSAYLIESSNL
ncbi:hypothetical protein UlMin_014592 [Ulmus minor]